MPPDTLPHPQDARLLASSNVKPVTPHGLFFRMTRQHDRTSKRGAVQTWPSVVHCCDRATTLARAAITSPNHWPDKGP